MTEKKINDKLEREYTIPLRKKSKVVPRYRKTPKAIKTIKEFLARHMKVENRDLNKVKIDKNLNEFLWRRGIRKHPHKIKVKVIKDGENVKVDLVDYPNKLKFKKIKEEKRQKDALDSIEKKKTLMQKGKESLQKKDTEKVEETKSAETTEKEKTGAEIPKAMEKSQTKKIKHQTEKPSKAKQPVRVSLQK